MYVLIILNFSTVDFLSKRYVVKQVDLDMNVFQLFLFG